MAEPVPEIMDNLSFKNLSCHSVTATFGHWNLYFEHRSNMMLVAKVYAHNVLQFALIFVHGVLDLEKLSAHHVQNSVMVSAQNMLYRVHTRRD
jgi:hypothetical protein